MTERENQPDEIDRANDLAARYTETYIDEVRRRNKPEQVQRADGSWPEPDCVECGDAIPTARLSLGKIRCIFCQEALERSAKR